jgi:hypothetical protein
MKKLNPFARSLLTTALAVSGSLASTQAGTFFSDFNSGVPAGMTLSGTAIVQSNGGFTNSGYLELTTTSAGGDAAMLLGDLDASTPVVSFTARFKVTLGNSLGYPADGMSFNFAPDLPPGTYPQTPVGTTTIGAEEGAGTGYTIEFDTYNNGSPDTAPAIDVKVGAPDHSTYDGGEFAEAIDGGLTPVPEAFVDCVIQLNPNNTLTVCYDGVYVYSNLDLSASGYTPVAASQFGIAARCGGIKEDCWIDDLSIVTYTNGTPFVNSFLPQGRVVATNSTIDIVLTDNTTQVKTNTIVLKLDGTTVSPAITQDGSGDTVIHYAKPGGFVLGSTHSVSLTYSDSATPTPQHFSWAYTFSIVAPPPVLPTTKVVFSDSFENYVGNTSVLDKNYNGSNGSITGPAPNQAPNGTGNPWWGIQFVNNAMVVTAGSVDTEPIISGVPTPPMVTPHSGTNMIRGIASSDFDQEYYNLPYRLRAGQVLQGNYQVDWWFYDPLGAVNTSEYRDYVALGYYSSIPGNTDYAGADNAPTVTGIAQRISLGAAPNTSTGVDFTKYQARIVGSSLGYNNGNFNTATPRTVGWHHGRIAAGPPTNNMPTIYFYIDDMVNPTISPPPPCPTTTGINCIELNLAFGSAVGFFDDFSVSLQIPPDLKPVRSGKNLTFTWPAGFTLQSAPVVTGPYTDVPGASYTGFTYDTTSTPAQFFRLRN